MILKIIINMIGRCGWARRSAGSAARNTSVRADRVEHSRKSGCAGDDEQNVYYPRRHFVEKESSPEVSKTTEVPIASVIHAAAVALEIRLP